MQSDNKLSITMFSGGPGGTVCMMKVHISTFYHNICQDQFFYYFPQTYSKLILITAGVQSSVPDTTMLSVSASGTSSLAAEVVFHVQHPDLDPQMYCKNAVQQLLVTSITDLNSPANTAPTPSSCQFRSQEISDHGPGQDD